MIKINLLPQELKRDDESSLTKIGLILKARARTFRNLGIAVILILAVAHIVLFFIGINSSEAFKNLSRKNNSLLPGKREYEALKAEVDIANKKAAAIDALMANRFIWAKKLNDLGDSMTQGIWLTDISYEEKPSEVTVQIKVPPPHDSGKKEAVKTETRKLNVRYLNISGYASSIGEQGTALVGKFIQDMKNNPSFYSDFSEIKLESIKSEKFLDQEVMVFKITCLFKTLSAG